MKSAIRNSASIIALIIILMISLYSISDATSNSAVFEKYYNWLVFFNVFALVSLLLLIVYNLYKLVVQYRLKQVGSRLTARMLFIFAVLTIIPVSIVYYFSMTFIHSSIDSWFDVGIENALEDSLQLSKSALDIRKREALKKAKKVAAEIPNISENLLIVYLNDSLSNYSISELTLVGSNRSIIASSSVNSAALPNALSFKDIGELPLGNHYLAIETTEETGLQIRVVLPVLASTTSTKPWQLHALFPITDQITALSAGVKQAYDKYKELSALREPLKNSFTLALSVIWLLSVLSAIWIAFVAAKKLVSPINDLVEGTQAVAAGDYETQLPLSGSDELGILLRSFNTMIRKISRSRQLVEESQLKEEVQKAYLESVLEHISSGVLTFNHDMVLQKANSSAGLILGVDSENCTDCSIQTLQQRHPFLQAMLSEIEQKMCSSAQSWQTEMAIFGNNGRIMLQLRGASFSLESTGMPSYVVVIDDLTEFIQAQKNSAWSEMARRLAHEIKNPLTPIQLSAERLQGKLSPQINEEAAILLNRYTNTIIQQVEAMKVMVNSFTDYARSSETLNDEIDLNRLLNETSALYELQAPHIELRLQDKLPIIKGDSVRIRQVIHNLIKNAIEASPTNNTISISSHTAEQQGCVYIELLFKDQGEGIPPEQLDQVFEPYVTNKSSGTGLGLAIVKKIIEEHGGVVWVENNADVGASFGIRLPVLKSLSKVKQ